MTSSVYLDLIRFGAAVVVVLHHAWPVLMPKHPLPWPGSQAVVVFFVLSGFVIAFVADGRESTLREYTLRRAARVWSVAIPALLLAAIVTLLVGPVEISDAAPPATSLIDLLRRSAANSAFLGQLWTCDTAPPLNGPFWSLNYEVWYYALFGAWTYLRGRPRTVVLSALSVISGPKILLMLPCWLAGVWLYHRRPMLPTWAALSIFVSSILGYLAVFWLDLPVLSRHWMTAVWPGFVQILGASNTFPGDYLIAALVVANFAAIANLGAYGTWLLSVRRPIAIVAAYTFSIYLYHMPLLALFRSGLHLPVWATAVLLITAIGVMGQLTERNLPRFRALLSSLIARTTGWDVDRSVTKRHGV